MEDAMALFMFLLVHMLVTSWLASAARLNIGAFLLSTESIRSPRRATRYYYRYVLFNFHYFISLLVMPVAVAPFLDWVRAHPEHRTVLVVSYLVICLLPASLLFYLEWRSIVWHDEIKLAARASATEYFATRRVRRW
jgi:hypothetical protein